MLGTWGFLTHGQNALCLGMGDGHMLTRMPLLLARVVLFLLLFILGTVDGPLRSIGEYSQFASVRETLQ